METIYISFYQVRVGHEVKRDRALIIANNKKEARERLSKYINNKSNNIVLTSIFLIEEYHGKVFTSNFDYEIIKNMEE